MADTKITGLTAVTEPADADVLPVVQDTGGTPITKKITWTVIKAFLKTYFDTLYPLSIQRAVKSGTFASGSTSYVMTDATVTANSIIDVYAQATPVGAWSVSSASGQFTITSTKTETSNVAFKYFINNV